MLKRQRESFATNTRPDFNIAEEPNVPINITSAVKRDSTMTGLMKRKKSKQIDPDMKIIELIQADL